MKGIEELREMAQKEAKRKYPNVPERALVITKYKTTSANGLTKAIIDFLRLKGWQAERISNMGRVIDNRKTYTNVIGQLKTIGSAKYIPSSGTNGTADISATIQGRSVKIEVKIGKDKQSLNQINYQRQIEASGGVYFIAKNFEQSYKWYQEIFEQL